MLFLSAPETVLLHLLTTKMPHKSSVEHTLTLERIGIALLNKLKRDKPKIGVPVVELKLSAPYPRSRDTDDFWATILTLRNAGYLKITDGEFEVSSETKLYDHHRVFITEHGFELFFKIQSNLWAESIK